MEEVQRHWRAALHPIWLHMVELQACACCCLRVAGVRSPEAYAAVASLSPSDLLLGAAGGSAATAPRDTRPQNAEGGADGQPTPGNTASEAALIGQKRRREEDPALHASGEGASSLDSATAVAAAAATAAAAAAAEPAASGPSSPGEASMCTEGPDAAGPVLCPLCFGLLPALSASAAALKGGCAQLAGCATGPVSIQVLLEPPAWRDALQLQASSCSAQGPATAGSDPLTGHGPGQEPAGEDAAAATAASGAVAATAAPGAEYSVGQPQGRERLVLGGQETQQEAQQGRQVVPCAALAEAASHLQAEFEFGDPAGDRDAADGGFALELSMPAALAVRAQALWWRLLGALGAGGLEAGGIRAPGDIVDLKEALKLSASHALSRALALPANPDAALRVSLAIAHPASAAEAAWLAPAGQQQQQHRRQRGRGRWGGRGGGRRGRGDEEGPSTGEETTQGQMHLVASEAVCSRLMALTAESFLRSCPRSAAELAPPAAAGLSSGPHVSVTCQQRPVYVGGRYLKLRRGIPQSPWFIEGVRKGESSVEEEISRVLLPALRPDAASFISAGREDIDVRMLGAGRPFVLELRNPRAAVPGAEALQEMERAINEAGSGVQVRRLSVLSPAQVAQLKEGESKKEKSYAAVCWLPRALSAADEATLGAAQDLLIQQRTPIRVLHRRANLTRPRAVHSLRAERLPEQEQYFLLHLRTQAGTYVKEFVHGDMGRTQPSLGDLLGGIQAQIAYLDVTDIHMDFLD